MDSCETMIKVPNFLLGNLVQLHVVVCFFGIRIVGVNEHVLLCALLHILVDSQQKWVKMLE